MDVCRGTRLEVVASACSERGSRALNEDSFMIAGDLMCVSDGIGGAPHGDIVSRVCCGALVDEWRREPADEDGMVRAFCAADDLVSRVSGYLGKGSGATLVAAARCGEKMVFGCVGDSAAWLLPPAGGLVRVFEASGRLREAGSALDAAMGYRMLQGGGRACVRIATAPMLPGTKVLLCTDGVWSQLPCRHIGSILSNHDDPYAAAYRIVREAVSAGGEAGDNATALVACVREVCADRDQQTPFSFEDALTGRSAG